LKTKTMSRPSLLRRADWGTITPRGAEAVPAGAAAERPAAGVPFVAPAEEGVAFRRDRLPLDADTMIGLSQQLGVLAQAQGGETPLQRRTAAQLLALALALQPVNVEARAILEAFSMGEPKPTAAAQPLAAAARAQVWQLLEWLETAAAGSAGRALAACLGDVMAIADPQHPRAEELRKSGGQGAWGGWVQPLEAFNKVERVVKNDPPQSPTGPVAVDDPAPRKPALLATATVTTPLWTYDKATELFVLRPVPVRMLAKPSEGPAKLVLLSVSVLGADATKGVMTDPLRSIRDPLLKALEKQLGKAPAGVAVSLGCGDNADYLSERNHNAISAAAALLMHAAITGCEPHATVIGEIQADGSFKLPPRFWDKLRALTDGGGGRLVLPLEAEPFLPAILAMEDSGFFLNYEVLLAANLQQLIARSAKTPSPDLAAVTANFHAVRSKLGAQSVAVYVANRFVRQRLEDLAETAPFHASARMLAMQGAGKRPSLLPRNILAAELRCAIQPMVWITTHPVETLQTKPLNEAFERCLREVDRLERYAGMRDRPLQAEVREMVLTIRTLARATRGRNNEAKPVFVPWRDEFNVLVRSYRAVNKVLTQTAADG
jgi:hypothetical protein